MKEKTTTKLLLNIESDIKWVDEQLKSGVFSHTRLTEIKQTFLKKKEILEVKKLLEDI